MKPSSKKLLIKCLFWLAAEIILNFVGLDNLADYSEFVFEKNLIVSIEQCSILSHV